ncbi:MAG: macro domain-containing protein [candidate division KSB1 bacterium]|nr:macro domain-containing protein [candidate division KSB1 bacterium]
MKATIHNTTIELVQGDITEMDTDAIVNAANERLAHGGGVAGAIVRKGGPVIQEESNAWVRAHGLVPTGGAAITSGGSLKARFVIHAVGPVMGSGNEGEKIRQATLASLRLAEEHNLASIAFPAISTGIFGCPMDLCAKAMLGAVRDHVSGPTGLRRIVFCLWDERALTTFSAQLQKLVS